MIDIITLGPYWERGVVLVSMGETQKEIYGYVLENYFPSDGVLTREYRRIYAQWKNLIMGKGVKGSIEFINDPKASNQASVYYDSHGDSPCILLLLPSNFSTGNIENMITLAHECLHVCQRILPIYLNRDEEHEAEAYFHSHLMRKVIEMLE